LTNYKKPIIFLSWTFDEDFYFLKNTSAVNQLENPRFFRSLTSSVLRNVLKIKFKK